MVYIFHKLDNGNAAHPSYDLFMYISFIQYHLYLYIPAQGSSSLLTIRETAMYGICTKTSSSRRFGLMHALRDHKRSIEPLPIPRRFLSKWLHPRLLTCIEGSWHLDSHVETSSADLGGGLTPPLLVGKFYPKRSFLAIFRTAIPPFRIEW